MIFNMLPRLSSKFTLSFLICKKKYPCSFPSLPHKNVEDRENNAKGLVWWIRSAIESQSICCISAETVQEECVTEFTFFT